MKKKLLITLGCSWTEGYGCYEKTYLPSIDKFHHADYEEESKLQRIIFHEYGWPNRIGKKLNYDKVINLGYGGSGQSFHLKTFYEKIMSKDFSEYEVLVIWMLSNPTRFSFYSGGYLLGFMPASHRSELEQAYLKDIQDIENDSFLESIFYVKCMEDICENKNFNLLITGFNYSLTKEFFKRYDSKYKLKGLYDTPFLDNPTYISQCGHPNELGYEVISQNMFECIKEHNPHLINENKVTNFEWEYLGDPRL